MFMNVLTKNTVMIKWVIKLFQPLRLMSFIMCISRVMTLIVVIKHDALMKKEPGPSLYQGVVLTNNQIRAL